MVFLDRDAPEAGVGQATTRFVCADLEVCYSGLAARGDRLLFDQSQRSLADRHPAPWLTLQAVKCSSSSKVQAF